MLLSSSDVGTALYAGDVAFAPLFTPGKQAQIDLTSDRPQTKRLKACIKRRNTMTEVEKPTVGLLHLVKFGVHKL